MRFAVYVLAFLLFICTWNLEQVFCERIVNMRLFQCDVRETFCGVEAYLVITGEPRPLFSNLRRLIVLRKLIDDKNTPLDKIKRTYAQVLGDWTGTCFGKFCIAVIEDPNSTPILKMSYPNPMVDRDNFEMHNPHNIKNPILATTVPILPLMPDLGYTCNHNKKVCDIRSSAYGAPPVSYTIPFLADNDDLASFTTNYYANGISTCFQGYCTFVNKNELTVKANFDVNHYDNIAPLPLPTNEKNEIIYESLVESQPEPQVIIKFEKGANNKMQYKCTYYRKASEYQSLVDRKVSLDVPEDVKDRNSEPILRFKAKNGIGTCVGYTCCFKNLIHDLRFFKMKFENQENETPLSWVKRVKHTEDLERKWYNSQN